MMICAPRYKITAKGSYFINNTILYCYIYTVYIYYSIPMPFHMLSCNTTQLIAHDVTDDLRTLDFFWGGGCCCVKFEKYFWYISEKKGGLGCIFANFEKYFWYFSASKGGGGVFFPIFRKSSICVISKSTDHPPL